MAKSGRLELLIMAFIGFVGILDTSFMIPIIALYAESLGASKAEAGFIAGFYSMVAIPASIAAGILVDRLGRKKMLVVGLLWDSLSVLLYSMVASSFQLLIVRGLHAIGGSLVYPAFIARTREISGERVGYSVGRLLAPVALAIALGTASAGFLTYMLGYRIPFIALSLIILLAGILALTLPERPEERSWRGLKGVVEGIREASPSVISGLWLIIVLYVTLGIIVGGLATSISGVVVPGEREARLLTGTGVSLSSLVAAVFLVLNGLVSDKRGVKLVILYSIAASTLGFILPAAVLSPQTILLGLILFGIGLAGFLLSSTILVTNVSAKARGTTVGLQQVLNIVGIAVGAPAGGLLAAMGPHHVLIVAALIPLLAISVLVYSGS